MANRFTGESNRLILDHLETSNKLRINSYLMTIDTEKTFDSLDHDFKKRCIRKVWLKINFIDWINIFLNEQQSCVTLKRGVHQRDPISAYDFILCLEILFIVIKTMKILKA